MMITCFVTKGTATQVFGYGTLGMSRNRNHESHMTETCPQHGSKPGTLVQLMLRAPPVQQINLKRHDPLLTRSATEQKNSCWLSSQEPHQINAWTTASSRCLFLLIVRRLIPWLESPLCSDRPPALEPTRVPGESEFTSDPVHLK